MTRIANFFTTLALAFMTEDAVYTSIRAQFVPGTSACTAAISDARVRWQTACRIRNRIMLALGLGGTAFIAVACSM